MSYIAPDDFIAIIDYAGIYGPESQYAPDDLLKLRDAGIQTVMTYLNWHTIETAPGVYDWSGVDAVVTGIREAGLKAIVWDYLFQIPYFLPESWYQRDRDGVALRKLGELDSQWDIPDFRAAALSYWNPDAWDYHLGFIERSCEHFDMPGVMCLNNAPANGEGLLQGTPGGYFYDNAALASFRAHVGDKTAIPGRAVPGTPTLDWLRATIIPAQLETQRIFVRYFGEYWTLLHHAFETIPATGNWLLDDLYDTLRAELAPAEHWGLCCTVFREGEMRGLWGPEYDVKRHGVKMLVAAEGPDGLNRNTDKAIAMGMRGMFCGPLAPYMGHTRMEEWMLQAIRDSLRKWEAST